MWCPRVMHIFEIYLNSDNWTCFWIFINFIYLINVNIAGKDKLRNNKGIEPCVQESLETKRKNAAERDRQALLNAAATGDSSTLKKLLDQGKYPSWYFIKFTHFMYIFIISINSRYSHSFWV